MNINDYLSEVKNFFDCFNRDLFNDELPEPILIIQSAGKKKFLGWCTRKQVWQSKDGSETKYEITVTSEYLTRPIEEIAETVLHEMIHLHNNINEIRDVSGMYYHNEKYKNAAEDHGLNVEKIPVGGWTKTSFNDQGWEAFKRINVDIDAFDFARVVPAEKEKKEKEKKPKHKYVCACGNEIKAKKEINITCNDCESKFEPMED
jgi:predicted SprT family Zn-dependent metalloprotease